MAAHNVQTTINQRVLFERKGLRRALQEDETLYKVSDGMLCEVSGGILDEASGETLCELSDEVCPDAETAGIATSAISAKNALVPNTTKQI